MTPVEHHVRIGQIKVGAGDEVLKTVLGSCVGIALLWPAKGKYALAHCLLPFATGKDDRPSRYVDQAVPRMLELLEVGPDDISALVAVVGGGARMMEADKVYLKFVVGDENLRMARKTLEEAGIHIVAFEPGVDRGTKMRIDCRTGGFEIERLPKAA